MLTFIIPVKSKKVSNSWGYFSKLFERTLKSICNQTSNKFRVVVVCHEKPDTDFAHPNLEFVYVDFEPPLLTPETKDKHDGLKEEDKARKILAGLEYIKKYDQDYVMVTDADDCISNKIAAYVDNYKSADILGWYFKKGYIYREGDKFISLNKENFNTLCGSCIIVKPNLINHIFKQKPHLLYVHQTIKLTDDKVLSPFPIPGSVYSMGNGENHYMSSNMIKNLNSKNLFSLDMIKSIIRKLKKYRVKTLNTKIRSEFGIYHVALK